MAITNYSINIDNNTKNCSFLTLKSFSQVEQNLTMLRFIFLLLSCCFITWTSRCFADNLSTVHPGDKVLLRINSQEDEILFIPIRKINSFLANENLPVWIVQGDNPDELIPDHKVMREIGQFSMYQDSDHSAAAVYFYNLKRLYGIVDVRFIIKAIPIEDINNEFTVHNFNTSGVISRHPDLHGHRFSRSTGNDLLANHLSESIGTKLVDKNHSEIRSRRDLPVVVYVQALIIVNYDVLLTIRREFGDDIGIVHYLLILFNNVDMLYSKVDEPNIKINIAGIIIGTDRDSFPSLAKCYKTRNDGGVVRNYMETRCTNSAIQSYLEKHSKVLPPDSHNVAIFLTSFNLRFKLLFIDQSLHGMASDETVSPYQIKQSGLTLTPVISVYHIEYFGNFHTIAHEMAHTLTVHEHDKQPYTDANGNCCAYLMKENEGNCKNCLSWSPATRESLKAFFNSRDRCFFIKKPRSLEKPGPRVIWTLDEQCQCYGYDYGSIIIPQRSLIDKVCRIPAKDKCETNLICYNRNGDSHIAPILLDGTPCTSDIRGVNKVCWNRECKSIQKHEKNEPAEASDATLILRVQDLEVLSLDSPHSSLMSTMYRV